MTSFNHYALGAVADWMHRAVGGLAPLEPGYAGCWSPRSPAAASTGRAPPWRHPMVGSRSDGAGTGRVCRVETSLPEGVTGVLRLEGQPDVELVSGAHRHHTE